MPTTKNIQTNTAECTKCEKECTKCEKVSVEDWNEYLKFRQWEEDKFQLTVITMLFFLIYSLYIEKRERENN